MMIYLTALETFGAHKIRCLIEMKPYNFFHKCGPHGRRNTPLERAFRIPPSRFSPCTTTIPSSSSPPVPYTLIPDDPLGLARALQACADARIPRHGAAVHTRLLKFQDSLDRSFSLWNKLLSFYCRFGRTRHAHQLFDRMPQREVVSFNTMISAHLRHPDAIHPLCLYSRMLDEDLKPNSITLSALLTDSDITASSHSVEQIHGHAIKFGINTDGFVGSAMVNSYARCRGLEEALCGFEEITEPDSVSWNIMIDVCARSGSQCNAAEIFSRMRRQDGRSFDGFTLTSVLKTCSERGDLNLGMQLHGCSLKAGLESDTPVGNALVTMYSRCEEGMGSATKVFPRILEPNMITWTAMVGGLVQNGLVEEAVGFYREMNRAGMVENEFCFASVLPAFGILSILEHGRMVHCRIIKSEFWSDVAVGNALIDMYFKCGSLEDARLVFETMRNHDVVSWTIMISGFGQHGKGREAIRIFKAIGSMGFEPDTCTFLASLSACSHGGLVDEGLLILRSMVDEYGVKPKREHCACIVDMLGRAGRLKEAEQFIGEMGMGSDPLLWEALLGACGIHGEKEAGERSAEKVMELEPHKDGPYVLLSNIYAERSMWEEKGKLRQILETSGLRKEAASSWLSGVEI